MRIASAAVCVLIVALAACHRRSATPLPDSSLATEDSVRGIVERAGSEPQALAVVRAAGGTACVLRSGTSAPFDALAGLDVMLWGRRTAGEYPMMPGATCQLEVSRYAVRAADGISAVDGMLRADGAEFVLETADGRRLPLRNVPQALRAQVGARIFWAGALDRAPEAYGVLAAAPR